MISVRGMLKKLRNSGKTGIKNMSKFSQDTFKIFKKYRLNTKSRCQGLSKKFLKAKSSPLSSKVVSGKKR